MMPLVDPWGPTNQGLATLGDTFDTLNARRRQDIADTLMAERDRREAEKDAIGMESARMTLDEQKRKIANLQAYDEARKAQEAGFASGVPAEVPNPSYKPAVPEGLNSTMTYAGEGNEVIPGVPAQGLPTMAGTRPMNQDEKVSARIQLAMQHGDLNEVAKLGHFIDITDKMESRELVRTKQAIESINAVGRTMGPQAKLAYAKKVSAQIGMDPSLVSQIVVSPQGILSVPDGNGGHIVTYQGNDGKDHVFYNKPTTEKTFKEGDTREIKVGDTLQTQEYRNGKWEKLSTAPRYKPESATSSDDKEEKRKVKALTEVRKEVERAYGFSQFLPTAQDPKLLQKVQEGKARAEDIIDNYKDYGLTKEPTPGKAAEMAKTIIDNKYNKKPASPAVEDKKSKSIRESLFGPAVPK